MVKNYTWLAVEAFEKAEAAKEAFETARDYRSKLWDKWYRVYWIENEDGLTIDESQKAVAKAIREDEDYQTLMHNAHVANRYAQLARKAALEAKKGQAV